MTDDKLAQLALRAGLHMSKEGGVWGHLNGLRAFVRLLAAEHGADLKRAAGSPASPAPAARPAGPAPTS